MALSAYLSGDEWDACFYASFGKSQAADFGSSMHMTIDALLAAGYEFEGLDKNGDRVKPIGDIENAPKLLVFFGQCSKAEVLQFLKNGRDFLKKHCPALVNETDDEWNQNLKEFENIL